MIQQKSKTKNPNMLLLTLCKWEAGMIETMALHKAISKTLHVTLCAIWYHIYNLKIVKTTHGRMIHLVKLQASKRKLLHDCFSRFLNCTDGTKLRKASDIKNVLSFIDLFFSHRYFTRSIVEWGAVFWWGRHIELSRA